METFMRNTPETDYVIKCNHVSADEHFDGLVTRVFCPAGQTTPSAYLIERKTPASPMLVWCVARNLTAHTTAAVEHHLRPLF